MIDAIANAVMQHLITMILVIVGILGAYGIKALRLNLTDHQLLLLAGIARQAVLYVQQTEPANSVNKKLSLAVTTAAEMAAERGLKIDHETLIVLIEASLKDLKAEFGDAWSTADPP